jgi:hypothetical protein
MAEAARKQESPAPISLTIPEAISKARVAIGAVTAAPVDAIRSCVRDDLGRWRATIEVIESPARMGDNDLMSAYELVMDPDGEMVEFQRVGRYHREDAAGL